MEGTEINIVGKLKEIFHLNVKLHKILMILFSCLELCNILQFSKWVVIWNVIISSSWNIELQYKSIIENSFHKLTFMQPKQYFTHKSNSWWTIQNVSWGCKSLHSRSVQLLGKIFAHWLQWLLFDNSFFHLR